MGKAKRYTAGLYTYRGVRIEKTTKGWEFNWGITTKIAQTLREAKYSVDFKLDENN